MSLTRCGLERHAEWQGSEFCFMCALNMLSLKRTARRYECRSQGTSHLTILRNVYAMLKSQHSIVLKLHHHQDVSVHLFYILFELFLSNDVALTELAGRVMAYLCDGWRSEELISHTVQFCLNVAFKGCNAHQYRVVLMLLDSLLDKFPEHCYHLFNQTHILHYLDAALSGSKDDIQEIILKLILRLCQEPEFWTMQDNRLKASVVSKVILVLNRSPKKKMQKLSLDVLQNMMSKLNMSYYIFCQDKEDFGIIGPLKQILVGRNDALQLDAVQCLLLGLSSWNVDEYPAIQIQEVMLKAGIVEFLCEAMASPNLLVLQSIFQCIKQLSSCKLFFTDCHVVYTFDSILRAIHFVKKQDNISILNSGFELLHAILQGEVSENSKILGNINAFTQLIDVVSDGLSHSNINIKMNAGRILTHLLSKCCLLKTFPVSKVNMLIEHAFKQLAYSANEGMKENVHMETLAVLCDIGCAALRFCSKSNSIGYFSSEVDLCIEKYQGRIYDIVTFFIEEICTSYVMEQKVSFMYQILCISYFQCVNAVYETTMESTKMSCKLLSQGMLVFSCLIQNGSCRNQELGELVPKTLVNLLVSLSQSVLGVDEHWPGGVEIFRQQLAKGLSMLPADHRCWTDAFTYPGVHDSIKNTVIIFIYFYSLSVERANMTSPFLYPILDYLCSLSISDFIPVPIVKAVWLIYAVSSLSNDKVRNLDTEEGTEALVEIISALRKVKQAYTHHPALLYWVFSSERIPTELQNHVMHFWLEEENGNKPSFYLTDLLVGNSDARLCLLDIMQQGNEEIVESAIGAFWCVINSERKIGSEALTDVLWDVLPYILQKYNIGGKSHGGCSDSNLSRILQLTSAFIPSQPNVSTVAYGSYLLANMLSEHKNMPPAFFTAGLQQAFQFLVVSVDLQDMRTLISYSNHRGFVNFLETAIKTSEMETHSTAILLLSFLIHCQTKFSVQPESSITIEAVMLLKTLRSGNHEATIGVLQLLRVLFENKMKCSFLRLRFSHGSYIITSGFIQSLYNQLQMLCVKGFPEVEIASWKCLFNVFNYITSNYNDDTIYQIALHPWMCRVVHVYVVTHPEYDFCPEFVLCFEKWVDLQTSLHSSKRYKCLKESQLILIQTKRASLSIYDQCFSKLMKHLSRAEDSNSSKKVIMDIIRKHRSFFAQNSEDI